MPTAPALHSIYYGQTIGRDIGSKTNNLALGLAMTTTGYLTKTARKVNFHWLLKFTSQHSPRMEIHTTEPGIQFYRATFWTAG